MAARSRASGACHTNQRSNGDEARVKTRRGGLHCRHAHILREAEVQRAPHRVVIERAVEAHARHLAERVNAGIGAARARHRRRAAPPPAPAPED
jgi:hypothetical protein